MSQRAAPHGYRLMVMMLICSTPRPRYCRMQMLNHPQKEDEQRQEEGILSMLDEHSVDMENTEDENGEGRKSAFRES